MEKIGSLKQVAKERTHWRDEWISERHRDFGWDVPMVDIDCVELSTQCEADMEAFKTLEYNHGVPVAIIEYKEYHAQVNLKHPSINALKWMADKCEIPFFVTIYYKEHHCFYVIPMNDIAAKFTGINIFNEQNYVKLLYSLRKVICPDKILSQMWSKELPKELISQTRITWN